jgi:hypothetical protein
MKKLVLAAALYGLTTAAGHAFNEPETVLGVLRFGASCQETKALIDKRMEHKEDTLAKRHRQCLITSPVFSYQDLIGATNVDVFVRFYDDRLEDITLIFKASSYDTMASAFTERYGPPTTTKKETIQNRMGASFQNELLFWRGPNISILLQKYGSKLDDGNATFVTKRGEAIKAEQNKQEQKKAAGDL